MQASTLVKTQTSRLTGLFTRKEVRIQKEQARAERGLLAAPNHQHAQQRRSARQSPHAPPPRPADDITVVDNLDPLDSITPVMKLLDDTTSPLALTDVHLPLVGTVSATYVPDLCKTFVADSNIEFKAGVLYDGNAGGLAQGRASEMVLGEALTALPSCPIVVDSPKPKAGFDAS